MSNYLWSAKNNSFIPVELVDDYSASGWDLSDAIDVADSIFEEYRDAPRGMKRSVDGNGMPCWVDIPPPSPDEQVAQADATKSDLQREAEDVIKPLERAKSLGIATQQELALLTEWEKYSVYIMRVDTSLAPNIEWPQKPQ